MYCCERDLAEWLERLAINANYIRNSAGFDPSLLRHSVIWGAADEAVLNNVHLKKIKTNSPFNVLLHEILFDQ
jgi:hypothetical protein